MKKGISPLLIIGGLVLLAVIAGIAFVAKNFISGNGLQGLPSNLQESAIEHMLPKSDLVSEDVSGTSKYDDTIRVLYTSDDCSEESMYYKQGDIVSDAYNYYKNDLIDKGWQIVSETNIDSLPITFQGIEVAVRDIKQITLQKGDYQLEVAVGIVDLNGKVYTVIHVGKNNLNCEQTDENISQEENQVNFDQIQEIQVSGFQAEIKNAFQPIINKAFGDSRLVDATMIGNYYGQKYYVRDKPTDESVNNFITYLQDAGYTLVLQDLNYETDYKIMVTGLLAGKQYNIAFSVSKGLNPGTVTIETIPAQ